MRRYRRRYWKRNRKPNLVSLIDAASLLPWWISLVLALISYLVFNHFSQANIEYVSGNGSIGIILLKGFSSIFQYIAPVIFIAGTFVSFIKQLKRKSVLTRVNNLQALSLLSWREFELLISEMFRQQGYQVKETQAGADGGVDIILSNCMSSRQEQIFYVQCKHWKKQKVGVKEVRELNGIVAAKGINNGILVTSGRFTAEAINFADESGIKLIDGKGLNRLLPNVASENRKETLNINEQVVPDCPRCGSLMQKKTARQGKFKGNEFWGCSRFPGCKGIRNI